MFRLIVLSEFVFKLIQAVLTSSYVEFIVAVFFPKIKQLLRFSDRALQGVTSRFFSSGQGSGPYFVED